MLRRRKSTPIPEYLRQPTPAQDEAALERPEPPDGAHHLVVVVLDSLRWDSQQMAATPNIDRLGAVERRWSYASWTAPSHYNLLMGLLPHRSPSHVYASEYYKEDFVRYTERLGIQSMEFKNLLPSIWLPTHLRDSLGYETHARVSMPVLNRHTPINRDFDSYELMSRHNDMAGMVESMHFGDRPSFWMLNVGETHYPYALPDEDPKEWPRISGVHGVFKHLDDDISVGTADTGPEPFFDQERLDELRKRQQRATSYVDGVVGQLYDVVPRNTWIVVTSDHGELFGEGGYFGHGPIAHEKVNEVPFVERLRP